MVRRTVFVTGHASATIAAATALHLARQGHRTLLLAADDPHRVIDGLLDVRLSTTPTPYEDRLSIARIDEQAAMRSALDGGSARLAPLLNLLGAVPLDPDELTPLPGIRPLALLRALSTADAEALVVAAPPPAELIATLALPAQLDRYLARLLPEQRQAARALRPLLAAVAGVPMPADWLFEARSAASAALAEARAAIEGPEVTVRLAVDASAHRIDELGRIQAGLALHGLPLDSIVAAGAWPEEARLSPDPWLARQAEQQRRRLDAIGTSTGLPVLVSRLPEAAPAQIAAELYGNGEPPVPPAPAPRLEDRLAQDGLLVWHLPLTGADRAELELVRRGDELVVGIGPYRRILPLPSALRRCTVSGARLADGVLAVRFTPDPALWPVGHPAMAVPR